eukprot:7323974-Ditylum_brightwellii.AAC.1
MRNCWENSNTPPTEYQAGQAFPPPLTNGYDRTSGVHQTHPVDKRSPDQLDFPDQIPEDAPHISPTA